MSMLPYRILTLMQHRLLPEFRALQEMGYMTYAEKLAILAGDNACLTAVYDRIGARRDSMIALAEKNEAYCREHAIPLTIFNGTGPRGTAARYEFYMETLLAYLA